MIRVTAEPMAFPTPMAAELARATPVRGHLAYAAAKRALDVAVALTLLVLLLPLLASFRASKNNPFMAGVANVAAKRLLASRLSRAISPALAHTSDGLSPATRTDRFQMAPT